jgi:hypothetical protein|tara:strand:+ start:13220 stop:13729 length:510 start_codon:yes stop_codon:yes gene_type:complete
MAKREPSIRLKPDNTVEINKHKTVSPYNSAKHLKYAKLPAECNKCIYRSEEDGGNGRCPKYEKDAACAIRKDIKQFLDQINTRNPEDLKMLLDTMAKEMGENVFLALVQAQMDGNIPDRNSISQQNAFLNIAKLLVELGSKITVTEKKSFDENGDLEELFRQLEYKGDA